MNDKTLASLKAARAMLKDEASWTQGVSRRNEHGEMADYDDGAVCQRCLGAALVDAALQVNRDDYAAYIGLVDGVHKALAATNFAGPRGLSREMAGHRHSTNAFRVVVANDWKNTAHADVLRWIDGAIEHVAALLARTRRVS